ncbi:MAG: NADPH-dependent F420 reductase [Acetobacteraceae bacterium]|nr:NADPH-dependent F420 reductase [Acetobacteraceae bacterium]
MSNKAWATLGRRPLLQWAAGAVIAAPLLTRFASAQNAGSAPASGTPMKIGVIGSGHIGGTVGGLWVKAGHPVLFSSRHPDELKDMVAELGPLAKAGTPAEAASFGEVLLVAVPYGALPQVGRDLAGDLKGKVVLDACNAVPARDGEIATTAKDKGIGTLSQELLPGARVVRAFNTLNYRILAKDAHRPGPPLAIPIAGNDADALRIAAGLVRDAGFEPVVVGPLARASEFALGAPGAGKEVSAAELRQVLGLNP